jgi:hypothetical protein
MTNNLVKVRCNRHTSQGRRILDLYAAYLGQVGNSTDPIIQAEALRAAELVTASEAARARLLAGDGASINETIRLENLSARTLRRLGIGGVRGKDATNGQTLNQYISAKKRGRHARQR